MTKNEERVLEKAPAPEISGNEARDLAAAVRRIDVGVKEILASGLNRKALIVLLNEATGVTRRDINSVLNGLESLGAEYLEKEGK